MGCFDGLLRLDNTCDSSEGVLSLQTLGINETLLKDITGSEDSTTSLLAEVQAWAEAYISQDIKSRFSKQITPHTFVDRVLLGELEEADNVTNASGTIGGIVLEVNHPNSILVLNIYKTAYAGKTTGNEVFTIYDLLTGQVVSTFTLSVTAGQFNPTTVKIALPSVLKCSKYFISHTALDTYRTEVGKGSCTTCGDTAYVFGGLKAYGARMSASLPKRVSNIQRVNHTSGLSVSVTLACDHAEWICSLGDDLALPYLYKVGQGIMDRALYAVGRMNNTRLDPELLSARAKQYMDEYVSTMDGVMKGIMIPMDQTCFRCKRSSFTSVGIP